MMIFLNIRIPREEKKAHWFRIPSACAYSIFLKKKQSDSPYEPAGLGYMSTSIFLNLNKGNRSLYLFCFCTGSKVYNQRVSIAIIRRIDFQAVKRSLLVLYSVSLQGRHSLFFPNMYTYAVLRTIPRGIIRVTSRERRKRRVLSQN